MKRNMKTCLFIGMAALLAFAAFQLKDFHIGIGERAMGGYDGSSTDPEAASDAAREAREAAARAEAAVDALKRQD
ncbi:hypothetical protein M0412_21970 [Agrobacterium sp. O3.4]|uniref:Uncharacterized protein n=2 Tax=Rhizobium/Agrobacterium group TaxID=227290 RepID=A0A546XB12_RHIRH|nr:MULTISPECIES: hypothetical protein [Rhizobium/Agrobacterium group]MCZ7471590.1 hypothetical protein [Rhizobium rhizogenes]MCZ7487990.1 hypothetical protein [Rhizobium rhizogenes]MDA5635084.1 hypothetical protein [Agrobacterium sp. ST15.16.024]MDF1890232.1 hypothetical protein [Rhizobium rhizogenes]TRA97897.1 hypothetical protein EXN68_22415 [Rhizobium rhizogenes]